MADWGSMRKGQLKRSVPNYEDKERAIGFALTVNVWNLWKSSFSGIMGKEVRFPRVIQGVSAEEMEEAGRDHSFKKFGWGRREVEQR